MDNESKFPLKKFPQNEALIYFAKGIILKTRQLFTSYDKKKSLDVMTPAANLEDATEKRKE
ncbi:MAG: hypothetical protein WCE54_21400 [Ignavibacteriaceae bacterium]